MKKFVKFEFSIYGGPKVENWVADLEWRSKAWIYSGGRRMADLEW